jgi:hypothetical protein
MRDTPPSVFDVSTCPQLLDFGLDKEIERVFKFAMTTLQNKIVEIKTVEDWNSENGAAKWWTLHYAFLLFGTCDAARVLATHNLAREAWINQRHAFEMLIRAVYFSRFRVSALLELRAEPIRLFALLKQSGITKGLLYNARKLDAEKAIDRCPEIEKFELPPFEQMVLVQPKQRPALYAKHYRMPSNHVHGSVLSFKSTMTLDPGGVIEASFDSRQQPSVYNELFGTLSNYVLPFCDLVAEVFEIERFEGVQEHLDENASADRRLNEKPSA